MARKLLIADNNSFYQQVLGDFFREEGYEVAVASDGVEALEQIAGGGIDLILLDLIMPRIDGARLCRFLKSHPVHSSIPVVILSGILADEIEEIDSIRADAYVAKMPMDKLQQTLRGVFASLETGSHAPLVEGFEGMFRREVVIEFLEERRVRETILNSIAEGIVDLSDDRRILRSNRAFEEIIGMSSEELLSRPLAEIFSGQTQALSVLFRDAEKKERRSSSALIEWRGRNFRLRLHPLAHAADVVNNLKGMKRRAASDNDKVRLRLDGRLPGFVLLVQDITEEVSAQEERDRFRERTSRSERMSALGMFVAGAAHELNNPLTGVLGYSQLLAARVKDPELKSALAKIEAGATRCRAIVENLMVFSRRGELERRKERTASLVEEVLREGSSRATACNVELRADVAEPLPDVTVARTDVVQALSAIVDNAILAAADGKSPRTVWVSAGADCGSVRFEVTDSGAGIPPRLLSRIFDPFFTTREVGEGRGLGLSVAFGVARAHGGTVSATNSPGGGARVSLRIPSDGLGGDAAAEAPAGEAARRGGRILIVDDEPVVVDLLADFLGGSFEIDTARNGREGLSKAENGRYDLILLDIRMPDMSGREMYEALRATRPEQADRVVFTTGDVVQEETRQFLDSVSQPCLPKPFSLDAVSEMVDRIIGASRAI